MIMFRLAMLRKTLTASYHDDGLSRENLIVQLNACLNYVL